MEYIYIYHYYLSKFKSCTCKRSREKSCRNEEEKKDNLLDKNEAHFVLLHQLTFSMEKRVLNFFGCSNKWEIVQL